MESQDRFSERERKVIDLLLRGNSNKQIAVVLGVSVRTIEFHLSNVYKKLRVTSRTEAVLELSKEHPRESADERSDELRKSTVEKPRETAENEDNLVQLRRQKMKNTVYVITSGVLLILIIGISLFGGQISDLFTQKLQASATPEIATATETPVVTPTRLPTAIPTLSYQILSPTKIRKDDVTFEASAELLTCAEISFEVNATLPSDYLTPRADPYAENDAPYILTETKDEGITLSSPDVFITRDQSFGGGGRSDTNGVHMRSVGEGYFVKPPLTPGQKIHLSALVSFNELFGITNPVPFEFDLIAGQCQ